MSDDELIKERDPKWVTLTTNEECAGCGKAMSAGQVARRARGLERHNGEWFGVCCQ